jgi:hypothetical protein
MNTIVKYTDSDLIAIAEEEHKLHPMSLLRDYYKLFFQAYWGQGHFIADRDITKHYLEDELNSLGLPYLPLLQDISCGKGLFRASVSSIAHKQIPFEDYLDMFMDNQAEPVDWTVWSQCWQDIQVLLLKAYPELNTKSEIELCAEVIKKQAIISHSECFRLTYNPHYRVMQLSDIKAGIFIL